MGFKVGSMTSAKLRNFGLHFPMAATGINKGGFSL